MTKASQKFLTASFPGEYTPEALAEIDTTRKVLFEAERLLHWHNMEWKKVLGIPSSRYTLDPPAPVLTGYQRVQKAKHERRQAKRAVMAAAAEYRRAVNEPLHLSRAAKVIFRGAELRPGGLVNKNAPDRVTSHTQFAKIERVDIGALGAVFEGTTAVGDHVRETLVFHLGEVQSRTIVISRPGSPHSDTAKDTI